jgi:maltose alpha-D-glucosyltransferase/alpha-amylase
MDPVYGYAAVNVEAQERSSHSLLNWMRRIISLRQRHPTFGRGGMELLRPENRRIFAFIRRYHSEDPILVVANLSRTVQPVTLDLGTVAGLFPIEMFGGVELPRIGSTPYPLTLGPYGFYWLRLQREPPIDVGGRPRPAPVEDPDQAPLLLGPEWHRMLDGSVRHALEKRYLPKFLRRQPWFFQPPSALSSVSIEDWGTIQSGDEPVLALVVAATFDDGSVTRYHVPLALTTGTRAEDILRESPDVVVVLVAGARKGVMHARVDGPLGASLLDIALGHQELRMRRGLLRGRRLADADRLGVPTASDQLPAAPRDQERYPSSAFFGEHVTLKVMRRLWTEPGPEGEVEAFVSSGPHYPKVAQPLAVIEYDAGHGGASRAALLSTFLPHQLNGWRHALDDLARLLDHVTSDAPAGVPASIDALWSWDPPKEIDPIVGSYRQTAARLGQRVGELHRALTSPEAQARFGHAVWSAADFDHVRARLERHRTTLATVWPAAPAIEPGAAALLQRLDELRPAITQRLETVLSGTPIELRTARTHGNLDLTQVLIYEGDFSFIGFDGDPHVPPSERRQLRPLLTDIASVLWSFQNAAAHSLTTRTTPDVNRLDGWTRWWTAVSASAFLRAYGAAMEESPFLPAGDPARAAVVRLLLLDRAFRELAASVTTAPKWVETLARSALGLLRE